LQALGYIPSKADTSLFMYNQPVVMKFVLIYIDDIIGTSSSTQAISALLQDLKDDFALKDLGNLNFFLALKSRKFMMVCYLLRKNMVLSYLPK
jgi:hypothetical protein